MTTEEQQQVERLRSAIHPDAHEARMKGWDYARKHVIDGDLGSHPRDVIESEFAELEEHLREAADTITRLVEERDAALLDRDKFHAIAEDKLADTRLVSAGGRGEGFGFDLTGGPIPYIAEYLFQFIGARDEKGPSNYAEIEVNHNTFGAMTLTLQRHSGQTPHHLRIAAEARAIASEAKVAELQEALNSVATILPRYRLAGKTVGEDEELDAVREQVAEALGVPI